MSPDHPPALRHPGALAYFLKVFIPLALLLAAVMMVLGMAQQRGYLSGLKQDQVSLVRLEREVLETNLRARVRDAVFLADLSHMALVQHSDREGARRMLAEAFVLFSLGQKVYDQVRLLDAKGWEQVRVDQKGQEHILVEEDRLQDKSGRYYVEKAIGLEFKQVYISPFDLNVEGGHLELPHKPTLRFASPVLGPQGRKWGLVVLNYLGGRLLDRLDRADESRGCDLYLVNRQGWWLLGPSREQEWGFMLPQRKRHNITKVFPLAWRAMQKVGNGQTATPRGLFTYQEVKILGQGEGPDRARLLGEQDGSWWVISRVDPEGLAAPWRLAYLWVGLGVLVLLALLTWLWAAARARRAGAEKEARDQHRRLEAISNTSQDAVALVDSGERVQFWNRAAERLFGYGREEALGNRLHRMVAAPAVWESARHGLAEFSRNGEGPILDGLREVTALRKDGTSFPAELSISAFEMDGDWFAAGNVRDISERKQAERELKRLANTDGLTGALNRRRFMELAQAEVARARRYGRPLSLVMLDLDRFKAVNDSHGHDVGDLVLQSLVRVSREVLRAVDIFGRVGGEEFMALLPETGLEGAAAVAERLRQAVAAQEVETAEGPLRCTASLGVAPLGPDMDLDSLMKAADVALYRAKQAGRDRVVLMDEADSPLDGENG